MLLVDTNVLVDVLQNDPQWADWSIAQLRAQSKLHALAINPVIYAELSLSFSTLEALDDVVLTMALELREMPRPALFLAARAYALYRRRGGGNGQVLPDFFIGAHAAVERLAIADTGRQPFQDLLPDARCHCPLMRHLGRRIGRRHGCQR